ncbi:MAG TPA: adenylate kinase [Anaerolineales bacterium]|jgi:adenylate kinase|nr:adenylate kinase [Anaerolineales bacterium]
MHIIFVGQPGSGKGTQSEKLKTRIGLTHISTGDLFREHLGNNTPLGQEARGYIDRGELVPDNITINMVRERLERGDITIGVIFDGFPRTIAQADALIALLQEKGGRIDAALNFNVSDDEIVRRLSGRIMCRKCNLAFHKDSNPFTQCPINQCSGEYLYQRDDDKIEIIRSRLVTYNQLTKPLLQYYEEKGLLVNLPGEGTIEEVTKAVLEVVQKIQETETA